MDIDIGDKTQLEMAMHDCFSASIEGKCEAVILGQK